MPNTYLEELSVAASGVIVGAVDAADTSCSITNGSLLPSNYNFRLAVWNTQHGNAATALLNGEYDIIIVTAHTGDTIDTMTRGGETGVSAINWPVSGGQSWQWDLVITPDQWNEIDTRLATALSQTNNWINVKDTTYGATGDGNTDDTTAVDAAITAAATAANADANTPEARTVYFPPGRYKLSSWTSAGEDYGAPVRLVGHSATLVGTVSRKFLLCNDEVKADGLTFKEWDAPFVFTGLSSTKSYEFSNLTFDACDDCFNGQSATSGGVIERLSVTDCVAKDLNRYFAEIAVPFDSISFQNCEVDGAYNEAVRLGNNNDTANFDNWKEARVTACNFYNIQPMTPTSNVCGVIMYGQHLKVTGTHIENVECGSTSGEAWGIYTKCRRATIVGNTIKDIERGASASHGTGIRIKGSSYEDKASPATPSGYNVVCVGNNIKQNGASGNGNTVGINISQDNVLCEGNSIDDFDLYGVEVDADDLDNIVINGNTIRGDGTTSGNVGVRLRPNGTSFTVTSNDVEGVDDGVHIRPTSGTMKGTNCGHNTIQARRYCYQINPGTTVENLSIAHEILLADDAAATGFEILGTAVSDIHISDITYGSGVTPFNVSTEPTVATTTAKVVVTGDIAEAANSFLTVTSNELEVTGNVTGNVTGDLTGSVTGGNSDTLACGDVAWSRGAANKWNTADDVDLDGTLEVAGVSTLTGSAVLGAMLRLTKTSTTMSSNAFTVSTSWHELDGEGAANDQLDTINGGAEGDVLILTAVTGRTITVSDGSGNLELDTASFSLVGTNSTMVLMYDGTNWLEVSRSSA